MPPLHRIAAVLALALGVAACQEEPTAPAPVRPVLSMIVKPEQTRTVGFAGTVQPRFSTNVGFQVLGRIIARPVKVGDLVVKGTRLASLDPVALNLAVTISEADVASTRAQLENAIATQTRKQTLTERAVSSPAELDAARQLRETAQAAATRAEASLVKSRDQLGYAELFAEDAGVVTATAADVGQVVAEGQTVVTIARSDVREAVIDVPEGLGLAPGTEFEVGLQIDPAIRAKGQVREIAPQADAATRTRRVKITLIDAPDTFRLGTTVYATVNAPAEPGLAVPRSALLEKDGATFVWIVDTEKKTVALRKIALKAADDRVIRVAEGIAPGDHVVTAGIHSLSEGQAVSIPDEAI